MGLDVVIGAPREELSASGLVDTGGAYVFDGTTFELRECRPNPVPAAGDQAGFALAVLGTDVILGAPGGATGYVVHTRPSSACGGASALAPATPAVVGPLRCLAGGRGDRGPCSGDACYPPPTPR